MLGTQCGEQAAGDTKTCLNEVILFGAGLLERERLAALGGEFVKRVQEGRYFRDLLIRWRRLNQRYRGGTGGLIKGGWLHRLRHCRTFGKAAI